MLRFRSTRGGPDVDFREALFRGLAPDGGLYHPVSTPDLRGLFAAFDPSVSFGELAASAISALLGDELGAQTCGRIAHRAFSFEPTLGEIGAGFEATFLEELYHGPSCAFKDFGAGFLAAAMEELLPDDDRRTVVLTATSGDTGSAVAHAFHRRTGIDVVVLYPKGRVSPLQEKQLTTLGGNIVAVEVAGAFDDCQRMVKEAFLSPRVAGPIRLTSANSINLGRLLPQSLYYLFAWVSLGRRRLRFVVPSGNFGNLTAGLLARSWGMEPTSFVAATNANDVVPSYLSGAPFKPRPSVATHSNAMDVGNPSNFERLRRLYPDRDSMGRVVRGEAVTDEETLAMIRRVHETTGRFVCPHTAVGLVAAGRGAVGEPTVVLATAHAAKFWEIVQDACGEKPPLPPQLEEALTRESRAVPLSCETADLEDLLLDRYA